MGVVGGDSVTVAAGNVATVTSMQTQFHTDIDVTFTLSGTTDNGLTFGAAVDLDEAENIGSDNGQGDACAAGCGDSAADHDGFAVFLSGNFGTVTMGDTDGGFDWGMAEVPTGSGSIADNETGHAGYNGNGGLDGTFDGQILRYDHSVGGLGFAVSIELDDTGAAASDPVIGLGLRYSIANINLGLGYQSATTVAGVDLEAMGLSIGTTIADIALGLNYSVNSSSAAGAVDQTHVGIGASYSMDAITIGVNWGRYDDFGNAAGAERSGFGLSAGYDLGGGASILLGYGSSTHVPAGGGAGVDSSNWSLGLSMSF